MAAPGWGATPVEKKPASNSATKPKAKFLQEDFPAQAACISAKFPAGNTAMKGQAIRLDHDAAVLFDPDLLRMAAGWTGGFITTHGVAFEGGHAAHPAIVGDQKFGLRQMPGWADARGSFTDCRAEPFGPLPVEWCRWEGHYVVGNDVVLAYSVLGTRIHEQPSSVEQGGQVGFVRTFRTEKARQDLATILCEVEGASGEVRGNIATLTLGTNVTRVGLVDAPRTARLQIVERTRIVLKLPRGTAAGLFKVVVWSGDAAGQASFARLLEGKPRMADIAKGGPSHWPDAVVTQGVLNTSTTPDGAYATDSITAPTDNPWKRRIRFAGLDFFADGKRAALCTHDGDVWIVSGIDDQLRNLVWRRFASGMYETLGLAIVDDVIYTSGRDQITRYHDVNRDGEADFYENFNNQFMSTEGFHEFLFDLQTDQAGNFYFAKANPVNAGGRGFGDHK